MCWKVIQKVFSFQQFVLACIRKFCNLFFLPFDDKFIQSLPTKGLPDDEEIEPYEFLRRKYNVPAKKQLSEVLELPAYTWGDVCELLADYQKWMRDKIQSLQKKEGDKV